MPESTDVAIIGGGAAGCAVAYYLGEAGLTSTIIEREGVGSQASGYAAGGLNPLTGTGIPGPLADFAWESFQLHKGLYPKLTALTEIDYQLRQASEVMLTFDKSSVPELQELAERFNRTPGFSAFLADEAQVHGLDSRIAGNFTGSVFKRGNYQLDSQAFTRALSAAAQHAGASVRPGTVKGLKTNGGNVSRVLLEDGELECGQVVLALGPWSRQAESWLNTYIPVDPLKGEILRMQLPGDPLVHDVSGGGASIYSKPDGLAWCGTTEDWRGFDRQPLPETRDRILAGVKRIFPAISEASLVMHTACLRPVTPDWLPIIGRASGYSNAWLATGAGKKGILLAPGFGKAVADLVTKGETSLPISNFTPERFADWRG